MSGRLTQLFVGSIMVIIIIFYYRTELTPFEYENYDNYISLYQQYDAELDEAIIQTRFGFSKNYDHINNAIKGMSNVEVHFQEQISQYPNKNLEKTLNTLHLSFVEKTELVEKFKRLNPILLNAVRDFSTLMAQIIEDEAHLELIETCSGQEYQYSLVDKANSLFRGVLIFTNTPQEQNRQKMLALLEEINSQPEKFENLDRGLIYAKVILNKQPDLDAINLKLSQVPVIENLEALDEAYRDTFSRFNEKLDQSRLFLYGLSILLLIVVHIAFKRLQDIVKRLQVEIGLKNEAQGELAAINQELEQRVEQRTHDLAQKNEDLNTALGDLKEAQDQLIMQEKMASVGMLTTGVAHEIKNPLNFINNFSDISVDLVEELNEEVIRHKDKLNTETLTYIQEILGDLKTNCSKINEHGKRADNIVKNMLLHSQDTGVQKEMVDMNALVVDALNIAYQGEKALHENFECEIEKDLTPKLEKIVVSPQTISRVFNYLLNNSFYTLHEKLKKQPDFKAKIRVKTHKQNSWLIIQIYDNGLGIPAAHLKKIFEPFYTTKPTGTGNTGLGLSICYDTIVKQHKGEMSVVSEEGNFTEMTLKLPIIQTKSNNA